MLHIGKDDVKTQVESGVLSHARECRELLSVRRGQDPELQKDRDPTLLQTFAPQTNENMNLFQAAKLQSFPTAVTGNRWSFLLRYIASYFFSARS